MLLAGRDNSLLTDGPTFIAAGYNKNVDLRKTDSRNENDSDDTLPETKICSDENHCTRISRNHIISGQEATIKIDCDDFSSDTEKYRRSSYSEFKRYIDECGLQQNIEGFEKDGMLSWRKLKPETRFAEAKENGNDCDDTLSNTEKNDNTNSTTKLKQEQNHAPHPATEFVGTGCSDTIIYDSDPKSWIRVIDSYDPK